MTIRTLIRVYELCKFWKGKEVVIDGRKVLSGADRYFWVALVWRFAGKKVAIELCRRKPWTIDGFTTPWVPMYVNIMLDGEYGRMKSFIPKPGWKILDLGANAGVFSLWASQKAKGKAKIVAFEPSKRMREGYLVSNVARMEGVSWNENAIVGRLAPGQKTVSLSNEGGAGSAHIGGSCVRYNVEQASCTTLDRVLKKLGPFDLLKMDIEGCEEEVLQYSLLLSTHVKRVVMETHDNDEMCAAYLIRAGFRVTKFDGGRLIYAWKA